MVQVLIPANCASKEKAQVWIFQLIFALYWNLNIKVLKLVIFFFTKNFFFCFSVGLLAGVVRR